MKRVQIELEFIFRASPTILYAFFTEPSNLVRWFCDEVDINDETFTFTWSGSDESADLIEDVENERVRFHWEDADGEEEFFEYYMVKSPLTGETILEIKDFCDDDEVDDQKQYWESKIKALRQATGG